MNKLPILILLVILGVYGCSNNEIPESQSVGQGCGVANSDNKHSDYSKLLEENSALVKKIESLTTENLNLIKESNLYWKRLQSIKMNTLSPTGCLNPISTFTMCKDGCSIDMLNGSNSMHPFFNSDRDTLKLAECPTYQMGDIVLFPLKDEQTKRECSQNNGGQKCAYYIHQIVNYEKGMFITKGSNNDGYDNKPLNPSDIIGKVVEIKLGT